MTQRTSLCFALVGAALLAQGCGRPQGSLTGRVLLNGEELHSGRVQAMGETDQPLAISSIQDDGTYQLTNLPIGPVTLVVVTYRPDGEPVDAPLLPPPAPGTKPPSPEVTRQLLKDQPESIQKAVEAARPVPLKYTDRAKSDLKVTVVKGETTFDIEMTGKGEIPKLAPTGTAQLPGVPGGVVPPIPPLGPGVPPLGPPMPPIRP
jgi:hypothetical protein